MEKMKNYRLVLSAEESFAQRVALGMWTRRPLTVWHYLLPGMFVWDLLRRQRAVQQYSSLFLFPRELALEAALRMTGGEDREGVLTQAGNKVQEWLFAKKVYSPRVLRAHMDQIGILLGHYGRVLQSHAETYSGLIRDPHGPRHNYEEYLAKLCTSEEEVDRSLAEIQGETAEVWERLRAEQAQVAQLRKIEADRIFSEEGEG